MDVRFEITQFEEALHRAGLTTRALCDAAGINPSTWTRWKSGANEPNLGTWLRVKAALAQIINPERHELDAA
jgi:hypothetical protein